tara:strand:+ start:545 stop:2773 length:2229 start_codon:yes stop_codon:yes gene_type:complete
MSNNTNKFRRAIHHLKSDQIDDRMSVLEAAPTNSTLNLMTVDPSVQVTSAKTETSLGLDFDKGNDDDDGKDTSGIFESDGTILTVEPPGDTSYILGPMASMWYAWGNFTRIGYIAQDTRRMVNLGSLTGELGSWDGSADDFTSYGQLTLAQAEWFRAIGKKDDADNDTPNYRAFYPGPPSSTADAFGRYLAVIVGEPKMKEEGGIRSWSNPINGPEDATTQFSMLAWWDGKGKKDAIDKLRYDPNHPDGTNQPNPFEPGTTLYRNFEKQRSYDKHGLLGSAPSDDVKIAGAGGSPGQEYTDPNAGKRFAPNTLPKGWKPGDPIPTKLAGNYPSSSEQKILRDGINSISDPLQRRYERDRIFKQYGILFPLASDDRGDTKVASTKTSPFPDQNLGGIGAKDGDEIALGIFSKGKDGKIKINSADMQQYNWYKNTGDPSYIPAGADKDALEQEWQKKYGNQSSKKKNKVQVAHHVPQGKLLSEERIWLREIKKPVKVPELQKKFKGIKPTVKKKGDYKIVGGGLMKDNIAPPEFSPTRENRLWRKYEVKQNERASQEKKNQVLELIGEGDHQWNYMLGNETWRSSSQMKKFYGDHDDLYDYYYGGKKHKVLRKEGLEKDFLLFIEDENGFKDTLLQSELNELLAEERDKEDFKEYYMKETEQKEREKNFDRATRLKSIVGRIKRGDIGPEYPNEPPPKMVNGWHPKFGKKYKHDKLDPISARSMPPTGDPEIDANVEKARKKPK